jgi:spermidine/putrescine transport system substrate-binding protein
VRRGDAPPGIGNWIAHPSPPSYDARIAQGGGGAEMRSEFDSLMRSPMGRRAFMKYAAYAAAVGGSGVLAACRKDVQQAGPGSASSSAAIPTIDQESGDLKVYEWGGYQAKWIWADYADAGYPDPKFSFLTNTEQALAKTAGGYQWDVTHPEVGYIQDYLNLDAIQPWDTSLIPNFGQLNPLLEEKGQIDGQQYEIVLDWGYSGVIIRTDHVDPSIDSYSYLFDDASAGHISWFDTPWILQMAGVTLGIPGPETFDMSADDLQTCKEYCIEKKKNLFNIWVDYTQMWDDVGKGNIWAAYAWPDAYAVLKDDYPVGYSRPKEGTFSWAEGLILAKDTENYHHAHEFADAWASAAVGLHLINAWGYGHANLDISLDKVDPEIVKVFGLDDPEGSLSEPSSFIDRYQPQRNAYNRAWDEVKAA